MLMSWPVSALVAGVKIGSGRRSDSRSPAGSVHAADAAGLLVFLPARARQVAARDAFDRHRLASGARASSARAASSAWRRAAVGERVDVERQEMVRHQIAHPLEPERRTAASAPCPCRECPSRARSRRPRCDRSRRSAAPARRTERDLVDVAHLAAADELQTVEDVSRRGAVESTGDLAKDGKAYRQVAKVSQSERGAMRNCDRRSRISIPNPQSTPSVDPRSALSLTASVADRDAAVCARRVSVGPPPLTGAGRALLLARGCRSSTVPSGA